VPPTGPACCALGDSADPGSMHAMQAAESARRIVRDRHARLTQRVKEILGSCGDRHASSAATGGNNPPSTLRAEASAERVSQPLATVLGIVRTKHPARSTPP
jgi:hypothetical protein